MAQVQEAPQQPDTRSGRTSGSGGVMQRLGGTPWVVAFKVLALSLINGIVLFAVPAMIEQGSWGMLAVAVVATIALDAIYLPANRFLPAKYLFPGTIFLLIFQLYPVLNTFYLSFTNYGVGHILSKPQAVEQITEGGGLLETGQQIRYTAVPVSDGATVGLLLTDPQGNQFLGTGDGLTPLAEAGEVVRDGDRVTQVGDFSTLTVAEAQQQQEVLQTLVIPTDGEAQITLQTFSAAVQGQPRYIYDEATDTIVDQSTGTEYTPQEGTFTSADGQTVSPGWRVPIGLDNYVRVFTSPQIRGPFLRVMLWTFAFAFLSMLSTFVVGLLLAMALNKKGLRGLRVYRSLLIFPYALPSFLTALIWAGLMNESFGALNNLLPGNIPWLSDPWMAKVSVLLVNLWLGFPYMFIVCLGALQSIPEDLIEAARTDGANGVQAFRQITLPLLFVSVAPLLIGTFAFNFNNFNIVFLLTGGGPPIAGAQTPAGHTDLLISYTYRLSFEGGRGPEYAFAAAIAVLIFLIVGAVSAYSFRYTQALEDIN